MLACARHGRGGRIIDPTRCMHACSGADGPENTFDGKLFANSVARAVSAPPTTLTAQQDYYAFLQLTLDREYSDIVAFAYYVDNGNSNLAYASNLYVYLSPTPYYQNGLACGSNLTLVNVIPIANYINCTTTISNANYVTLAKRLLTGNALIYVNEFQIFRAGALIHHQPATYPAMVLVKARACIYSPDGCLLAVCLSLCVPFAMREAYTWRCKCMHSCVFCEAALSAACTVSSAR